MIYNDFTWQAEPGKMYGIVGPNGSGKTTILKCIASHLVTYNGSILYDGIEAKERDPRHLGKCFYYPDVQSKLNCPIGDLFLFGVFYPKWDPKPLETFLENNGYTKKTKILSLSKGFQKQLLFYYALSCNPDILLLDEITDGIDIASARQICKDLLAFFDDTKTVIIAAHHIQDFETLIDEYSVIHDGKIVYSNTRDGILNSHGWIDEQLASNIARDDILDKRSIMGKTQILIKNIESYSQKFEKTDIATIFAGMFTYLKEK